MRLWHAVILLPACGAAQVAEPPLPVSVAGAGTYVWTEPRDVPEAAAPAPSGGPSTAAATDKDEPAEEATAPAAEESAPAATGGPSLGDDDEDDADDDG